jgi:hypothetical protein
MSANGQDSNMYREREAFVYDTLMRNGVSLSRGSIFFTEELGWFRLTFTIPREELVEGMSRLMKGLSEVERHDWEAQDVSRTQATFLPRRRPGNLMATHACSEIHTPPPVK